MGTTKVSLNDMNFSKKNRWPLETQGDMGSATVLLGSLVPSAASRTFYMGTC